MIRNVVLLAGTALALLSSSGAMAASKSISAKDSFRIGDQGVLCTAQSRTIDPRFSSMFDRGYDVVCRDAAQAVAQLYALKIERGDPAARFEKARDKGVTCEAAVAVTTAALAGARRQDCRQTASGLNYTVYTLRKGGRLYAAEGLSAYDSALQLGLVSLVSDRSARGEITVATTNAGDPAAFAKVQAEQLDAAQALAAGYGRNVEGSYAEASQFFESLVQRSRSSENGADHAAVYLANQAMQQSNLGNAAEADRLFAEAARATEGSDPLFGRLFRNLRATHKLNNRDASGALEILDSSVPPVVEAAGLRERLAEGYIERRLAQRLAIDDDAMTKLGGGATSLTENERGTLLDAQAHYLRGVALRLKGDKAAARAQLDRAVDAFSSVRGGAVTSMAWLFAGASTELAQVSESEGRTGDAVRQLGEALATIQGSYPDSAVTLAARARLAGVQARSGKAAEASATYHELVRKAAAVPGGAEALRALIKPYFDLLAKSRDASAASDFFVASQAMVRPGVAQTQAVFARELSGGSDEASGLFRQSVTLSRELVSVDVEIARLTALDARSAEESQALAAMRARRAEVGAAQTALLAKLAAFPKFRVTSNAALELSGLQASLGEGEAYYKLLFVGEAAYGLLAWSDGAKAIKLGATRSEMESMTNKLRDSIVLEQNNQLVTNPFDLETSHRMFEVLFGAMADKVPGIKHLIFEPDGPLLKLPANVLVTDKAGLDAYAKRQQADNPDEFDYTGIAWMGRNRMVSTAVSAQSFVDVRKLAPSKASRTYLGVGQNTPTEKLKYAPQSEEGRDSCDWALSLWSKPINSAELRMASSMLGGIGNEVIIEEGYSDSALRERKDLNDFRILQFATHGLVTAPKPGCPARPALVTSFGKSNSDGLLSFKEIFDLRLDADTVILSACDTAGAATAAATREAGITTGGNFAMDGLVRAFVGAGARTVIASHWPIPDDYDATRKLMSVIYEGGTHQAVGESMRLSQNRLMDDPVTSHPYYWGAFAIVGDAGKPLTTDGKSQMAGAAQQAQVKGASK